MPNSYFQFKQFKVDQQHCGMKITTDACLLGAWIANRLKQSQEPKRILDIGTGTGLLALMLAQVTKKTTIDAVELNQSANEQAKINFEESPWAKRLTIFHTPIQQFDANGTYDLIVCNPPFFSNSTKGNKAAKNLALHNEFLSVNDLINAIKNLLSPNGTCYLLYPEREMNVFTAEAIKSGLNPSDYVYAKNEKNQPVFRVLRSFSLEKHDVNASELIIRREDGKYTEEFWNLLKDYYLEYNDPAL